MVLSPELVLKHRGKIPTADTKSVGRGNMHLFVLYS